VSVSLSDAVFISGDRLFHVPRSACRAQMATSIETGETGVVTDTRYGALERRAGVWWRHQ